MDFKLENVLVFLHSLKTMGLGSIIFKEWRVTWTFSYTECDNNGSHDLTDFNITNNCLSPLTLCHWR